MPSVAHIIRRRRSRKQRQQETRQGQRLWAGLAFSAVALLILIPVAVTLGLAGFLYVRATNAMLSPAETIYLDPIIGPTNLYDRTGETLLYAVRDPLGNDRVWIDIESLPDYVPAATLRIEDPDYLETGGFDFGTTLWQLWRYILGLPNRRDTSLAGRLADAVLIPPAREQGLDEELLSLALSAEVQRQYTPRRVLEWYINTAYYGNDAYGIDAAAQVYFGKTALDLTLDEAALLAAVPTAPQFNPFDNEAAARGRQTDLLRDMLRFGEITPTAFDLATAQPTTLRTGLAQAPVIAEDFALYAREQVEDILYSIGLDGARLVSRGGLTVTTSLDTNLYYQAECTLRAHLQQLRGDGRPVQTLNEEPCGAAQNLATLINVNPEALPDTGSLLLQDALTGEIRVLLGDATSATQQLGPTLHPFVYLQGLLSGNFTPATMLLDIPQPFPGAADGLIYTPVNPDGQYRGPLNLRDAMVGGLRAPATFVADREGLSNILSIAHAMGLNSLLEADNLGYDLSLIERGGRVSLLDLTYAYSVLATQGVMQGIDTTPIARNYRARNPVAVLRIEDAEGNLIWAYDDTRQALSRTNILEADSAHLINDILSDNDTREALIGDAANQLAIGRPAAVVNGLTGNNLDSWTVGYTPQLVLGVHLDRSDNAALSLDAFNTQGSAAIWQALMRYAHTEYNVQPAIWQRPDGVADFVVCERSGLTPTNDNPCPRRTEIFLERRPPVQEDIYWQSIEINTDTGLRATLYTPEFLVSEAVYFVPPPAALDWWRREGLPLPPQEFDTLSLPETVSDVEIFLPQDFAFVGEAVDVRGSINIDQLDVYQLSYGVGFNPSQWLEIGQAESEFTAGSSLGNWDTSALDGSYTLRLTVRRENGVVDYDYVPVTVDNTAPEVTMLMETLVRWPAQATILVQAQVQDNRAIDRVEFYHDGALIDIDNEWPYEVNFPIERVGIEVFTATAFDEVGNTGSANASVEVIRSG